MPRDPLQEIPGIGPSIARDLRALGIEKVSDLKERSPEQRPLTLTAMPQFLIVALRIIHIVGAVLWVGGVTLAGFFVMPSIVAAGPAGGAVMMQLVKVRKFSLFMMAYMGVTILSGLLLMWWSSAGFSGQWMASPFGRTLSVGAGLAIVATLFGVFVSKPSADRLQALGSELQMSGKPPTPEQAAEMQMLQGKLLRFTRMVAVLLLLAAAAMASARYM